jgi:hypothetical protein
MPSPDDLAGVQTVLDEPPDFFLDDLSAFIWDTVLLHDAIVLSRPDYEFEFDHYFWRRGGRPLRREDRARVLRVRHESPFLLEIAGTLAAIVVIGKSLEWLHNWPARRAITKSEANQARAADARIPLDDRIWEAEALKAEEEAQLALARIERERAEEARESNPKDLLILPNRPRLELPREAGSVLEDEGSREAAAQTLRRLARSPIHVREVEVRRPGRGELPPPQ